LAEISPAIVFVLLKFSGQRRYWTVLNNLHRTFRQGVEKGLAVSLRQNPVVQNHDGAGDALPACQFDEHRQHWLVMSAAQATAEVFVTAFKSLKRREREAVFERLLADDDLSEDIADTLALEARRHQPRQSFRQTLKELNIRV
jgi:hypothetical protein